MVRTINIAGGDYTNGIQKRTLGKLNIGFYCDCGEFIAFAVTEPGKGEDIAFASDGLIVFRCPFCEQPQRRVVTEIEKVVLTEGNKRKSSPQ